MRHGVQLPGRRLKRTGLWCNGSTIGSNPLGAGSTPARPAGSVRPGTPTGRATWLKPKRLWVRLPLRAPKVSYVLVDQSGLDRRPVTAEATGSNPVEDADDCI